MAISIFSIPILIVENPENFLTQLSINLNYNLAVDGIWKISITHFIFTIIVTANEIL